MSLLQRTARRSFSIALSNNTSATSRLPFAARAFSSNAPQWGHNELLKNAPGWKHENASASEASVKADRDPQPTNIQDLQRETVEHVKKTDSRGNKSTIDSVKDVANMMKDEASKKGEEYMEEGKEAFNKAKTQASNMTEDIMRKGQETADKAKAQAGNVTENIMRKGQETADKAGNMTEDMMRKGQETADRAKTEAGNMKEDLLQKGQETADRAKAEAGNMKEDLLQKGQETADRAKINASRKDETVFDTVKAEAQKAKEYVQESLESAKKAVGMDSGNKKTAEQIKAQANQEYKLGNYAAAVDLYSQSIKLEPTNATYYGNRSAALMMIKKYSDASMDCQTAVQLDSMFVK
ncbi:DnaJ sub C member 7, partial [Haplosporangium sp. Z 11]